MINNMSLDPNLSYLTLQLKWGREEYEHELGFNMSHPDYLTSELSHKGIKLTEPPFLYKFFPPNDLSLESFEKHYLYFSDPKGFGDEYDCLVSDDAYIQKVIDNSSLIKENLGVCCFCSIPNEDQMWDYYAGGFKGFALKYKNDNGFLIHESKPIVKSFVMYLEDNGSNDSNLLETLKSMEGKHVSEVVKGWQNQILYQHELCRKRIKYQFEKEYRAISFYANEFDRCMPIEPKYIDSIIIGHKMKNDYLEKLIPIIKQNKHVKIYVVKHDHKKQQFKYQRAENIKKLIDLIKT